jgi:hypothetical protein
MLVAGQASPPPPVTPAAKPKPPQAGQPMNPVATAVHFRSAEFDALRGDNAGVNAHVTAMSKDFLRSARMPDPTRPIDHEMARSTARHIDGVRSAVWMDQANLIVMVDGAKYRNADMIDAVCVALETLGDTLAVVVNVQDVTATSTDGATTLSRNCQLPDGQRALLQAKKQVDVVSPELRAAFKAQQKSNW